MFSRWCTERGSVRGEAGHVVGIIHGTSDVAGRVRDDFDENGTTDGAGWFTIDEIDSLPRVELLDFVLGLIADAA